MMVRRALSLMLMLQLVFVQFLQCRSHAACGAGPEPHVHVDALPFARSAAESHHHHGHGAHGHQHHHAHEVEEADVLSVSPLLVRDHSGHEHDSDAVYFPAGMHADRDASRLSSFLGFGWDVALPAFHEFALLATALALRIMPAPGACPHDPPRHVLYLVFLI